MNRAMLFVLGFVLCILLGSATAEERPELGGMAVFGNRELPKALVIVPWKAPDPGALDGKPVDSLLDEVLVPVDRDVFLREIEYYDAVHLRD